jgi:PAS domain S-box-containing protein
VGHERKNKTSADTHSGQPLIGAELFGGEGSKAEMDLETVDIRLQHVLSVCPAIIYTNQAGGDYLCTFVSENILPILGYTQREMLDDPDFWTSHLHPQDMRPVLAEMYRLIPDGGGILEYRFRHRDGHYRWFQDTFKTVYDSAGKPLEIVGAWADITQRKLAESFQTLSRASLKAHEPRGLKKWFDDLLWTARDVLHIDRLTILLADPEERWLQAVASTETLEPLETIRVPIGPAGGAPAHVFLNQKLITCDGRTPLPKELQLEPPYDRIEAFRSHVFAVVPLLVQGKQTGVLVAGWRGNRPFDPSTLEPLELLATQAAVATEHTRLYAAAQPVLRRSLQLSEVYPAFAAAVKALLAYDRIGVVVPEGEKLVMALSVAVPPLRSWEGQSWPVSEGTAGGWVLAEKRARIIRDLVLEHGRSFSDDQFLIEEGVRSTLMLPLLVGDEAVGFFFLDNLTPNAYTERDLELLDPVAQQLALAIQNNRLLKELQEQSRELARSVEELKVLGDVAQAINSTLDLPTVLTTILIHAAALSETEGGAIYEFDENRRVFLLRATHGLDDGLVQALNADPPRLGEGAVGQSAVQRIPISVADVQMDTYEPRLRTLLANTGYRSLLSVPLLREDRIVGGLVVYRKATGEFSPQVVALLRGFATQSALAFQNAHQFHEIELKGRQLEVASKHKSQFLANMSHELRTPLNAILGYTELILDDIYGDVSDQIREVLLRLEANGRHLLRLINDVLDLSKIESGRLSLSITNYSLKEVIRAAMDAVEPLAVEKGLQMTATIDDDLPMGKADERRITQILLNLIGNAIKFTEAGEVKVEAKASEGVYLVSVSDTGPGIAEADQQRIFDEFQQAEVSRSGAKGGTGLGLSIAKRIIELHGGRIWLETSLGQGSTFRFELPISVEQAAEAK